MLEAEPTSTYHAKYRALARRHPSRTPAELLAALMATTPGQEGKWFAAAKRAELFDLAAELAHRGPCDPRTLCRAARDHADVNPGFAIEAGVAALRWLLEGHGFELTGRDVREIYAHTMKAARHAGRSEQVHARLRALARPEAVNHRFVMRVIGPALEGLSSP